MFRSFARCIQEHLQTTVLHMKNFQEIFVATFSVSLRCPCSLLIRAVHFMSIKALTREWSGLSGRNLAWNFARLQSPSHYDCTQNFSYRYAVQGCETIAQSWNVQFKFAPPRTRVTQRA
jgi:hypothetical protein